METLAMLVVYGMELGGSYARDPMDSYGGDCDFRLDAVTSPERLQAWFDKARYLKELALAQATAKRVLAGFASPEGSAHAILLGFPSRLGGTNVGIPLLNYQLVSRKQSIELLERSLLGLDLHLPRFRLVSEHYGAGCYEGVGHKGGRDANQVLFCLGHEGVPHDGTRPCCVGCMRVLFEKVGIWHRR